MLNEFLMGVRQANSLTVLLGAQPKKGWEPLVSTIPRVSLINSSYSSFDMVLMYCTFSLTYAWFMQILDTTMLLGNN